MRFRILFVLLLFCSLKVDQVWADDCSEDNPNTCDVGRYCGCDPSAADPNVMNCRCISNACEDGGWYCVIPEYCCLNQEDEFGHLNPGCGPCDCPNAPCNPEEPEPTCPPEGGTV